MGGMSAYFFSGGVQTVLFPWLIVIVLEQSAERVGIAQMLAMMPMLILGLFGGATADRKELRRYLMRLQVAAAIAPLVLVALYFSGYLIYEVLVAYAIIGSALGAFTMPARDSLLNRVANTSLGGRIQQAVTMATGAQFMSQVVGLLIGGLATIVGAAPLMIAQSLSLMIAAATTMKLPKAPPSVVHAKPEDRPSQISQIREGIDIVWRDENLRSVILMMFFAGILYIGVFMVLFPLLIRDIYGGGSFEIAFINICFFGGIGVSSMMLTRFPPIKRQGRAIMLAMCSGSIMMVFVHFHPPLWAVFALALCWGLSSGISMSQSRAIVQIAATDSHRARVLSVFQLGMMGGGPIGAFGAGFVIQALGPLDAVLIPSSCMVVLWLVIFFGTNLWKIEAGTGQATEAA
jgi:MFS family permease